MRVSNVILFRKGEGEMLDNRFVEEYKKIKPTDELKTRILCSIIEAEAKSERKPFYLRMRPMLSGALACVLLVCCLTVIPFDPLGAGDVSVSYAQTGEFVATSSTVSRAYELAAHSGMYYEYDELQNGCKGAEFTFEFGGNTELKTEYGSIYLKNADGTYKELGQKTRIGGIATLFWAMPENEYDGECVMTIKNRSGELRLSLELLDGEYKANLVLAE